MERLVIAAVIVLFVGVLALVNKRRRVPDAPTQRRFVAPEQLDRADFPRPEAPWLVAVFSSATCDGCQLVIQKANVLASDDVAVADIEYTAARALHERYHVDAVPTLVIADAQGVARAAFAIYNPTDSDVEVDVVFLGLPLDANFGDLPQVQVPAREVVVFDPADEETGSSVPDGRHATVFSTLAEPSIVVERVLTRPAGDSVATSVVMGAPPRPDGYVASRWHVGSGPSTSTGATIVVYNVDNLEGSIAVESVGPAGPSAHDEFADIPIGPGAVITIDLEESELLGRELIITASNRVFVELLLPRGHDLPGWSGSWALPASDA